ASARASRTATCRPSRSPRTRARPCGARRCPPASTCSSPSPWTRSSCSRPSIVSPPSRTSRVATMTEQGVRGSRILVVDDDADARESLGLLLELDGHEVAYAHDGAEAIRCEAAFAPALVLLDLGLPDIDGTDV